MNVEKDLEWSMYHVDGEGDIVLKDILLRCKTCTRVITPKKRQKVKFLKVQKTESTLFNAQSII